MSQSLSVVLRFENYESLVLSYAENLSSGLVALKTSSALPIDTEVRVKVQVENPACAVSLLARVEQSTSEPDSGARYAATLRIAAGSNMQQLEEFIVNIPPDVSGDAEVERRKLTLVVVDDSPAQRELASRPFLERGDTVHLASDGLEGLALCLKHKPDVVLSDVQMPKMDGWQLLRVLKGRPQLSGVPMILLTTLSSEEDRLRGYRLGVDDYIAKPYATSVLIERVERAVQHVKVGAHSWVPPRAEALRGDLRQVSLPALLSFLALERKSGTVRLEPRGCLVVLDQGRPIRARSPASDSLHTQERALYELLSLTSGRFEFVAGDVDREDSIRSPLTRLLMEHARLSDEAANREAGLRAG